MIERPDRNLDYWLKHLSNIETLALVTDFSRPSNRDFEGQDYHFELDSSMSVKLRKLAKEEETTLHTILLSGLYVTLAILSEQQDIVVGTILDNDHSRLNQPDNVFFANALALRGCVSQKISLSELIKQTHQVVSQAKYHQDVAFDKLIDALGVIPEASHHPIFQVVFGIQHFTNIRHDGDVIQTLKENKERPSNQSTEYDLSMVLDDSREQIHGKLTFALCLFEEETVAGMTTLYQRVLLAFINNSQQSIAEVNLLSVDERNTLLDCWRFSDSKHAEDSTLHQLFEEQVRKTPDSIAVVFEEKQLTYRELDKKANQWARIIRSSYKLHCERLGFEEQRLSDVLVTLYLDKSLEMIVSLLAVLKSGAAYVPLSPEYPEARIQFILDDTQSVVMLTQQHHRTKLEKWTSENENPPTLISIDENKLIEDINWSKLEFDNKPNDLAYVVYTSGTSGEPKGVMVTHSNLCAYLSNVKANYQVERCDRVLQFSNFSFDIFVEEILASIFSGATLVFRNDDALLGGEFFWRLTLKQAITILSLPTAFWHELCGQFNDTKMSTGRLRLLIVGGEAMSSEPLKRWRNSINSKVRLLNTYGPTETTVVATVFDLKEFGNTRRSIPIGKPLPATFCYVLNGEQKLCPVSVPGELYIGGAGVAKGYLNRPELTAKSFINNPYSGDVQKLKRLTRLYKTGDRVRWLPDGNLEFLGRNDGQVKINGYRIELNEIEVALGKLPDIKQSLVTAREGQGGKYLAAYLVTENGQQLDIMSIRHSLLSSLPNYMLPTSFAFMESLPLTANGKVNRKALPSPTIIRDDIYVAPTNDLERKLCLIWEELLGLDQVGICDNYFGIGGNSITAMRITIESRRQLGVSVSLASLFKHQCIKNIVENLNWQETTEIPCADKTQLPLSFAQERLLFIEQFQPGTDAYHIPYCVKLKDKVNWSALKAAFNTLVERHSVLKMVYSLNENSEYHQRLLGEELAIPIFQLSNQEEVISELEREASQPFELETEHSIRVRLYETDSSVCLLIVFHHIAVDGWSIEIFLKELGEAYQAFADNRQLDLPRLAISYTDYAAWQRENLRGERLEHLLTYWRDHLEGFETLLLPTDFPRPRKQDLQGNNTSFKLGLELSTELRKLAKARKTTLYTVLLSGFYVTLATLTNQTDIVIGTPSDNRQYSQTQSLVGLFVNTLALRAKVSPLSSIEMFIDLVHKIVMQGKEHQELPFEKLVDTLGVERELSRHPIFQIMFALDNFDDEKATAKLPFESSLGNFQEERFTSSKFDLSLFFNDLKPQIIGNLTYASSLFSNQSIERFMAVYQRVLQVFTSDSKQLVSEIDLVSSHERNKLVYTWNQTAETYPKDRTLHQIFEEQASKSPDGIALVLADQDGVPKHLTYAELDLRAERLAYIIQQQYQSKDHYSIRPNTLIALYLDKSLEMIVSMLAVLKAGAAYVPISPDYPKARTEFILNEIETNIIITGRQYVSQLGQWCQSLSTIPALLDAGRSSSARMQKSLALPDVRPTDLAYVIYTSGTTGKPKGVMIEHHSVSNHLIGLKLGLGNIFERVDFSTNYCFDLTVATNLCPLLAGGTVCIYTEEITNVDCYRNYLKDYRIGFVKTTPSIAALIELDNYRVKTILTGGERLTESCIIGLRNQCENLFNEYGPTETTVGATFTRVESDKQTFIGRPFPNVKVFVLSSQLKPLPIGAAGELFIGGVGVARGYYQRPALTAERFIANPFKTDTDPQDDNDRLYRTGDIVRWLPSGNLEFIGRNDSQVKIRGYRIELAEIENVLKELAFVKQAVVISFERKGNNFLAAYLVYSGEQVLTDEELSEYLSSHLPSYMVPSTYTVIKSLPLTANGKLNHRALPSPEFESNECYALPRNDIERKLCSIWESLLGLKQVGIYDNYFRIGGNSIAAIRLTAASRDELGFDIPLSLLFEKKTIAGIAAQLELAEHLVIPRAKKTKVALSFAQERLLFIERYQKGTDAYHVPYFFKLGADVDILKIHTTFELLIDRHSILKTVYLSDRNGNDYQELLNDKLVIHRKEFDSRADLLSDVKSEIKRPFDLTLEHSLRLFNYHTGGVDYLLLLFHHIAVDGWSIELLMREFEIIYQSLKSGCEPDLDDIDIDYADYALWQREFLQGERLTCLLSYWEKQLSGYEPLKLLTDHPRPVVQDYRGLDFQFQLSEELSGDLRTLAKSQETTLYTILLSGFYVTLATLSAQEEIVIGTPSDNRQHAQTQSLIGFFVNSLVLRARVKNELSISEFIAQIHRIVTQALVHQELPFDKLVDALKEERDQSRHPIFQVLFTMQVNGEIRTSRKLPFEEVALKPEENLYSSAKFDLSLLLKDVGSHICGEFNYAISLFESATIERVSAIYQRVLKAFVTKPQQSIMQIDMLSRRERQIMVCDWGSTENEYPKDKVLHELFEEQVMRAPNSVAITCQGENGLPRQLTYFELNSRANQFARVIRDSFEHHCSGMITPDCLIPLYLDRSVEMVVSILAVLKAGATYVPISPEYPKDRVGFLFEDTSAVLVISNKVYRKKLNAWQKSFCHNPQPLLIDDEKLFENVSGKNLEHINTADDLAYVIYTSGTTGNPKGVMTPHRGVVSLVKNNNFVDLSSKDTFLHLSNPTFDAATFEVWAALTNGAKLSIAPSYHSFSIANLARWLTENQISILWLTKTLFDNLYIEQPNLFGSLRYLLIGGEALTSHLVKKLVAQEVRPKNILNGYGPTECTTFTTTYLCEEFSGNVPLGKPINTRHVYVLNASGDLVPIGVPGELHVSGAGLARGYLNRPELTKQRFIDNQYASDDDRERGYLQLYKTGDIVRWLPCGNLEYLGRNDNQVKIRGYRIELGEIESVLNQLACVEQALVIDHEGDTGKYLVAYIVVVSGKSLDEGELTQTLLSVLPDYMVPRVFSFLNSLPLTVNGKLDRKLLRAPELKSPEGYAEPRNELERKFCEIWERLLGIERVGIHDNYFRIGGNSITAIRVIAAARNELGVDISLAFLFEQKTIYRIVSNLKQREIVTIPQSNSNQPPLTFAQERLLFIERYEQGTDAYHIPYFSKLKIGVTLEEMQEVFQFIIERHSVLRTIYSKNDDGDDYQQVLEYRLTITEQNLSNLAEVQTEVNRELSQPFDLTSEIPIRLRFYRDGEQQYLFILWHHIAIDGWSVDLFLEELEVVYEAISKQLSPKLQELDISYSDYAVWQRQTLQGQVLDDLLDYWLPKLSDYETLDLPSDRIRPSEQDFKGKNFSFDLPLDLSTELRSLAKSNETTLFTVLLSGFYVTLSTLSGQQDLVIGTPSDNRLHAQTQSLVGFFVNSLVMRTEVLPELSVKEFIKQVHQVVTQAKIHQELPFERLVELLQVERDPSRHPVFQVMFSLQRFGEIDSHKSLPFEPIDVSSNKNSHATAKFDLMLFLNDEQPEINAEINYAISLFDESTISRMSSLFVRVLKGFVTNECQPIKLIDRLSVRERDTLLNTWNQTNAPFPIDKTLHELFEQQVLKTPHRVALVYSCDELGPQQVSYETLNEKANQLANWIRKSYQTRNNKPIQVDSLIALYLGRGIDMVVGILAVLKSGGAYVPLSTEFPEGRIRFILEDTKAELLLTEQQFLPQLTQWSSHLINLCCVAIDDDNVYVHQPKLNLDCVSNANDLAYVIYTSGTTGKPKGVEIEHSASACRNRYMSNFGETYDNNYLFKTNYIFDVSVSDIFCHLLVGAKIIISQSSFDLDEIKRLIAEQHINSAHFVPSQLSTMSAKEVSSLGLKKIYFSGENLTKEQLNKIEFEQTRTINYYGPTESGEAIGYLVKSQEEEHIIGTPFDGVQAYIIQNESELAPVGAQGELFIGGKGLARGYLNRPTLTQEKFVSNPFAPADEKIEWKTRLYKTGDRARWLADGRLEYLGRTDSQVKIRGFRIELREVENQLILTNLLKAAVVIDRSDKFGQKHLIAYVVSKTSIEESELSEKLHSLLQIEIPDYMIPSIFVKLESIPLTQNGKLDKRSLPEPEFVDSSEFIAPETNTEMVLVELWAELLKIESLIGVNANFFKLGGHSLLATKLASRINLKFSVEVKLKEIFIAMTLRKIAKIIDTKLANGEQDNSQRVAAFHQDSEFDMEEFEL